MSVNDQLARIVKSPPMVTSPSLCRFLRYIVEETLAGRVAGIKEQVLGLEVFDRGQNFNPRLDPIVRVQARNLRSRLAKYYEGPGRGDPIRIELPKGTYIPVFHQVAEVTADVCAGRGDAPVTTVEASPASVSASVKRQIPPSLLLAALIVVMILMGILSLLDKMHFKG